MFALSQDKYRTIFLLFLITLHLFLMNGFYPTHRQLTVGTYFTSIRNFVDPSLYKNSIYVQAINRTNLRISIAYDAMPFILKHLDFELFGMLQGIVSIFFIIAGIYRLSQLWFSSPYAGYLAALLYTPTLNIWTLGSPSPYLNFYHHGLPITYPLIIWSMVFFWQKRFICALFLAGCSWNFHPMCTAFLLFSYCVYWFFNLHIINAKKIIMCFISFALPALPAFMRSLTHITVSNGSGHLWLKGVSWVAGYTCFPSEWPLTWFIRAGLFFVLFLLCYARIKDCTLKQWIAVFVLSVLILCLLGTVFADIVPVPFVIKASLWRSTIIYLFIALPCIGWGLLRLFHQGLLDKFVAVTFAVLIVGYIPYFGFWYLPFYIILFCWYHYQEIWKMRLPYNRTHVIVSLIIIASVLCAYVIGKPIHIPVLFFIGVYLFLMMIDLVKKRICALRNGLQQAIMFVVLFDGTVLLYNGGPDIYYHGTIKGRCDPWADIQKYARTVSSKDDVFIVPPYMNDFSLYSYRAVLGDWAEGSTLLYLDNTFTKQWFERMYDLGWTEKHLCYDGYNRLTTAEVLRAAQKYGAAFIVTEKPKTFQLKKIYENSKFILYRAET